MEIRSSFKSRIPAIHWALISMVYGILGLKCFLVFSEFAWDYTAYHLPFALMHYGLTTYRPDPALLAFYEGFPALPHWIMGFIYLMTGSMNATASLNWFGVIALAALLKFLLREKIILRWWLTFLLAVPMIVLHLSCGYVDLWTNCGITLAFASLFHIFDRPESLKGKFLLLLGLVWATTSKYTSYPPAAVLVFVVFVLAIKQYRAKGHLNKQWIVFSIGCVASVVVWPTRNFIKLGNPLFPGKLPAFIHGFRPGVIDLSASNLDLWAIPTYLRASSNPVRFLFSVFELNRLFASGIPYVWTLEQGVGPDSPHQKIGGWFFLTMFVLFFALVIDFVRNCRQRFSILTFSAAIAITANMYMSHYLRYHFYIPMVGFLLLATSPLLNSKWGTPLKIVFLSLAATVFYILQPLVFVPKTYADSIPPAAKLYIAEQREKASHQPKIICAQNNLAIFFAGKDFNELPVENTLTEDDYMDRLQSGRVTFSDRFFLPFKDEYKACRKF